MTQQPLLAKMQQLDSDLIRWRRHLHRNPELSHVEFKTAAYIRAELEKLGIANIRSVATTGIVAEIGSGTGPCIGLRADIDALPIQEQSDDAFASSVPGVMHACGHDAHTAMLLGTAKYLQQLHRKTPLNGTVRLIFQPAEETADERGFSGAQKMIAEGVLDGLDYVFAQHVGPSLPVGRIAAEPGVVMAASDSLTITIHGKNAHGAAPHMGIDAIAPAGPLISSIQQIIARMTSPFDAGVITLGAIHGGSRRNIIADKVVIEGTVRSLSPQVRQDLHRKLMETVKVVDALGGRSEIDIQAGYPMTVNDPDLTRKCRETIRTQLGSDVFHDHFPPSTGAEDFAFMSAKVPGCFFRLGAYNPEWGVQSPLHTADFRIDERAMRYGTANLIAQSLALLPPA